ncbi:MAG: sulfite exporter TauE/SafE family protein [Armatimonadetes bacterium]|nr:sulfite exporter TauE/SafE family protein [Armatimonadota bacterium]
MIPVHFPVAGVTVDPWLLLFIGFTAGVCGGFFGIGGAFLVTPALNILGFPMACAIGTDLAHITGKSVVSARRHQQLGNLDVKAGMLLAVGTVPGVEAGARAIAWLERSGEIETVVRSTYVLLLAAIGGAILWDWWRHRRRQAGRRGAEPAPYATEGGLAHRVRSLRWKPCVSLPRSGIAAVSVWALIGIAFATGFCAGFLGVGGGFIRMPAMLYLIGMPTRVAVGTDLLEVLLSGAYGTFTYALRGRVDLLAALVMLVGGAVGSHIGAIATDYVVGYRIRLYFALTALASAVAVALKQWGAGQAATVLLLSAGSAVTLAIILGLGAGLARERRRLPDAAA